MGKIITVFGATGNQGGSVVKTILAHPKLSKEYKIRGVTRDPKKEKAQALHKQGVDVVAADLADVESLRRVIEGASAVFAVTNYWESRSRDVEVSYGRNIADAAKAAGVELLVWSSLPNATKLTGGKLKAIEHFDGKAEIEDYIRSLGIPAAFFMPAVFMQNIKGGLQKPDDNTRNLAWNIPADKKCIPFIDVADDTGKFVAAILQHPEQTVGKHVYGATAYYSPQDVVDTIAKVSGKKVNYQALTDDQFKGFLPPPIAAEMTENWVLIREYDYYGPGAEEHLKWGLKLLDEKPTTFEEFVKKNEPW